MLASNPMSSKMKRFHASQFQLGTRLQLEPTDPTSLFHSHVLPVAPVYLPIFHHESYILQHLDITHRIAIDRNHIRKRSRSEHSNLTVHREQRSRPRSRAPNRIHRA